MKIDLILTTTARITIEFGGVDFAVQLIAVGLMLMHVPHGLNFISNGLLGIRSSFREFRRKWKR